MGYQIEFIADAAEVRGEAARARYRPYRLSDAYTAGGTVLQGRMRRLSRDVFTAAGTLRPGRARTTGKLTDRARATSAATIHLLYKLTDSATASDRSSGVARPAPLRSSAEVTDRSVSARMRVESLRSLGTVGDDVGTVRLSPPALRDRVQAADRLRHRNRFKITEQLTSAGTIQPGVRRSTGKSTDTASVSSALRGRNRFTSVLHDAFTAADRLPQRQPQRALGIFRDSAVASSTLVEVYGGEVWVTNTASGAASYWVNVQAHAATVWNGKLVVADAAGIHILDQYTPVDASVRTPLHDLGNPASKRVAAAQVDGGLPDMQVTATATGVGGEQANTATYPVVSYANGLSRSVLGRGLNGRYWEFTLSGVQPFYVRSVTTDVAASTRRA